SRKHCYSAQIARCIAPSNREDRVSQLQSQQISRVSLCSTRLIYPPYNSSQRFLSCSAGLSGRCSTGVKKRSQKLFSSSMSSERTASPPTYSLYVQSSSIRASPVGTARVNSFLPCKATRI